MKEIQELMKTHGAQQMASDQCQYGQESAGTLAIISGQPRQMALNALSSQQVELPPLPTKHLRVACADAFRTHCGETLSVSSVING